MTKWRARIRIRVLGVAMVVVNHEIIATKELGSRQKLRIRATVVEDHRRYQGHGTPPRIRATVKLSPSVAFGKRPGQSGSTQATDSPPP